MTTGKAVGGACASGAEAACGEAISASVGGFPGGEEVSIAEIEDQGQGNDEVREQVNDGDVSM